MRRVFCLVVFFTLSGVTAQAAPPCYDTHGKPVIDAAVVCSKAFNFHGTCGVTQPQYPWSDWDDVAVAMQPWESSPITIVAATLDVHLLGTGRSLFDRLLGRNPLSLGMFIGNSYNLDPMSPYEFFDTTENVLDGHVSLPQLPAGHGMQLPAADEQTDPLPTGPHLDAHINCSPKGASYVGFVFVWYTLSRTENQENK